MSGQPTSISYLPRPKLSGVFHLATIVDDLEAVADTCKRVFDVPSWHIRDFIQMASRANHRITSLVVDEETNCLNFLVDMCGATVFARTDNGVLGTRSTYVAIGDRFPCTVEVAVPIADGPPRDDLYRNGDIGLRPTIRR